MKQYRKKIAAAILAYLILVLLLMLSEQRAGGPIHSFGDAVWYSLVTLTTVGYGDLYPITAAGKAIGSIFVLLSLGFLAFVVGAAIALLTGQWLPKVQLMIHRRKQWWVFSEKNDASEALAADLLKNHPNSLPVFCGADGKGKGIHTCLTAEEILSDKNLAGGARAVFLISEDEVRNRSEAAALESRHTALYCRGEWADNAGHTVFFSAAEACARDYWQRFPAEMTEKDIVLLGCGEFARSILDQAILANCMTPFHTLTYHMAGNWQTYLRYHHKLDQCFSINCQEAGRDALIFCETDPDPVMLSRADRVILCGDDPAENARTAHRIGKWLVLTGKLHVLTSDVSVPGESFGSVPMLFTEAAVMKQVQDAAAKAMHETYRKRHGGPGWEELSPFMRASNRAVADHLPMKKRLLSGSSREQRRRNEHDRWMRFHALYNWTYDAQRDNDLRHHPSMQPFEQLSEAERAKDDYAWEGLSDTHMQ